MNTQKQKWAKGQAWPVAHEVCALLAPWCERVMVAGSLRRGRESVGDVEILYVPKLEVRPLDMFATEQVNVTEAVLSRALVADVLAKRPNKLGGFAWGAQNKLAVHVGSGMPVDLFATTEACWWNYLVCRTGPAESNMRIATAAIAKGWKWNPYSVGFSRGGDGEGDGYDVHAVHSEEEVFAFVGLPFLTPEERR